MPQLRTSSSLQHAPRRSPATPAGMPRDRVTVLRNRPTPSRAMTFFSHRLSSSGSSLFQVSLVPVVREDFLYVFRPGRHGPDALPLHPASARSRWRSATAPGGWRATRDCDVAVITSRER
ncbi:MAG: hypothetical protein QOJ06_3142, partial [Pseudonocardiales bacterium]|nr:hypothetical protein [Pseudonocardiales bacterium]